MTCEEKITHYPRILQIAPMATLTWSLHQEATRRKRVASFFVLINFIGLYDQRAWVGVSECEILAQEFGFAIRLLQKPDR